MKLLITLFVIVFVSTGFTQEPPAKIEQAIQERAQKVLDTLDQQTVDDLTGYRKETQKKLAEYNALVVARDGALTEKLKRAVADGDETLIKVALNNIRDNKQAIDRLAGYTDRPNKQFVNALRRAYERELISEETYLADRQFFRNTGARINESTPVALTKIVDEAKKVVPDYFAFWEKSGYKFY